MTELRIDIERSHIPGTVAAFTASIQKKALGRVVVVCRQEKGRIIFSGAGKKIAFIISMFVFPEQRGKKQDVDTLLIDVLKKQFDVVRMTPMAPADFENLPKWGFKEVIGAWEWRRQ